MVDEKQVTQQDLKDLRQEFYDALGRQSTATDKIIVSIGKLSDSIESLRSIVASQENTGRETRLIIGEMKLRYAEQEANRAGFVAGRTATIALIVTMLSSMGTILYILSKLSNLNINP